MPTSQTLVTTHIPGLLRDLIQATSCSEVAEHTALPEEELKAVVAGTRQPSSNDEWMIESTCNKFGFFKLLAAHGFAPVPFDLSSPFNLFKSPIGFNDPPTDPLRVERTVIAGYPVDFPLGLPASILTANATWIEFYARRGFDILTYKTVRTRYEKGHNFPYWVFLEDPQAITDPSKPPIMRGYEGYWPQDTTRISMANSFGIPSFAPAWWQEDVARARKVIKEGHQVLIVSIVSSVKEGNIDAITRDFVNAALMAKDAGGQIIEANYSCPNVQGEHDDVYQNPSISSHISKALMNELRGTPLIVKIGYLPEPKLREFVKSNAPFVNGIVAINTVSAKIVNEDGKQTFPDRHREQDRENAGVSGWAIKAKAQEVATNLVALREEFKLGSDFALLGLGGVLTKEDCKERKATGVTAVESCTGAFMNPLLGVHIRRLGSDDIGEIVRLEKYGLAFVKVEGTGEEYPFRFDQIVGFKGEPLGEMCVRVGSRVSFDLQNGRVCLTVA